MTHPTSAQLFAFIHRLAEHTAPDSYFELHDLTGIDEALIMTAAKQGLLDTATAKAALRLIWSQQDRHALSMEVTVARDQLRHLLGAVDAA